MIPPYYAHKHYTIKYNICKHNFVALTQLFKFSFKKLPIIAILFLRRAEIKKMFWNVTRDAKGMPMAKQNPRASGWKFRGFVKLASPSGEKHVSGMFLGSPRGWRMRFCFLAYLLLISSLYFLSDFAVASACWRVALKTLADWPGW